MKTEFKNGDHVRIVKFSNDDKHFFAYGYTSDGFADLFKINPEHVFVIAESNVMPISYIDGEGNSVFYPLAYSENSHRMKFYVPEESLELVEDNSEDEFDEENLDNESIYDQLMRISNSLFEISRSLANLAKNF